MARRFCAASRVHIRPSTRREHSALSAVMRRGGSIRNGFGWFGVFWQRCSRPENFKRGIMFHKHLGVLYDFDRKQVGGAALYFSQPATLQMETLVRAIERD